MSADRLRESVCQCGCGKDSGVYARTERGHVAGEPRQFLPGHRATNGVVPAFDRLMAVIEGLDPEECWEWPGVPRKGYGRIGIGGRIIPAHRYAYEQIVGPIPEGLVLDHLCRNKVCVNPRHLEPVTNRENVLRGDAAHVHNTGRCKNGHSVEGADRWVDKTGRVHCLRCSRERRRKK